MEEFPTAYIVPMGSGQRSEPEANRLVDWLLANGIVVDELKQAYTFDGVTYPAGSYVVLMNQAHRGLADTALGIGADISEDISILYAPPAAWSHGYLWGADVVRVPSEGATFTPNTNRILKASHLLGGVEPGTATRLRAGRSTRRRRSARSTRSWTRGSPPSWRWRRSRPPAAPPCRPGARYSAPTRRPRSGWPRSAGPTTCGSTG